MDTTKKIFANNQRKGGTQFVTTLSQGACQPQKNITTVSALIRIMFMYSARKNSAKLIPEYSIMCPATISDSPSTTSNGARLVSATPLTKYTTSIGASGSQFHDRKLSPIEAKVPRPWALTMSDRLRLPDTDRKSTRLNSSHGYISYAVFCLKKKKKHNEC